MISFGVGLTLFLFTNTAQAQQWTGSRQVTLIDSLTVGQKFITLAGFTNASCDENRIFVAEPNIEYQKELFTMLLSAFLSGKSVNIFYAVSGGQCRAARILLQ